MLTEYVLNENDCKFFTPAQVSYKQAFFPLMDSICSFAAEKVIIVVAN